jgi:hypothetical protein
MVPGELEEEEFEEGELEEGDGMGWLLRLLGMRRI